MTKSKNITFYGGVGTVTGANFLLELNDSKILIDCGLVQDGPNSSEENNLDFLYNPLEIDFLFITHAHMDHIGRVCKLVKDGFSGEIYSTLETKELARTMLLDALNIMNNEKNSGNVELYDSNDYEKAFSLWKVISYHENKDFGDFSVFVKDAGHILGSAMYEFIYTENGVKNKIVFTGDTGNSPSPLLRNTEEVTDANYLVIDSVYGDRNHESKEERDEKFKQVVMENIKNKGVLIIPAFSVERTQVILYELNNLVENKEIPSIPIFLDSPLGVKVTEIYKNFIKDFNDKVKKEISGGDNIFDFPKLKITHSSQESRNIENTSNPKIIIAGSGMSVGGRVLWHEAEFLPDPKNTILFIGYQAVGTLGREIQNNPNFVYINNQKISVRAKIETISGYSSHRDSDGLIDFIYHTKDTLKKIFVVMGEPKSSTFLTQRIRDELDVEAICPELGESYKLN